MPFLLGAAVIVGALIILVGAKINPEMRDIDLARYYAVLVSQ
jgi:hypothetical protein